MTRAPSDFDASDYERPPRKVAGALTVAGLAVGLAITHEPSDAMPEAHRLEVRAWRDACAASKALGGVFPTFREAWAELLRFIEAEVRP